MIIESIKLINFRNYSKLTLNFNNGINYIYGKNASGKTNLVEAIYFLSIARSFRTSEDKELINLNSELASITASIRTSIIGKKLQIYLTPEGKKILLENRQVKKISELNEIINCLYFYPKDVLLLKDAPRARRNFLNIAISKNSSNYLKFISAYEKLLKERNELLKKPNPNLLLLETITERLITYSKEIYLYRRTYSEGLNSKIKDVYQEIADRYELLDFKYVPFIDDEAKYEEKARKAYAQTLKNDLKKKMTSIGVHKEDFYLLKNGLNVGEFGSQGENRLAVLALKLTPYFLIEDEKLRPIVILDDVLSELDEKHRELLIKFLRKLKQVFITNTEKINITHSTFYKVEMGNITKEDWLWAIRKLKLWN